ncbi:MAG: NAD(P)-dependent dehydrogenase (short-subunit alcohol dehydrogenase family) [Flavobacteriales bacterium]|jgi:NAD(P)-dependent dehydrogenase (short-subunit alcohol dehydrogenase family)|tara:strand:- start:2666 stop:3364 length:699 start_codon:yes stop_codon:yes gene_type:complete
MKNILIIGASSGIGAQLSKNLAASGYDVTGTYNENTDYDVIPGVSMHQLNVMEDELNMDFIPETIDGLVYCVGSINLKPFKRIKPENFLEDFSLQVVGAIKVLQRITPHFKNSEAPSVVFFSTVAVQNGFNFHSQVSTSKGAIEGLTRALAAELAPAIRVNCIAPSLTQTPLASKLLSSEEKIEANDKRHPLGRIGQPEDLAQMAQFLLSSKSGWITGQVFGVDGGMSVVKG